jgi:recombinational DNA repair ATPase RecF
MEDTTQYRPAVAPEEFAELRNMQAQQTLLQSQGYQAFNFLKTIDHQFSDITKNYNQQRAQVQEQLDKVETELLVANNAFQQRFREIIAQYGYDGATAVNIEETEPHYITEVAQAGDAAAAPTDFIPTQE